MTGLTTNNIIKRIIDKMPTHKRDSQRVARCNTFTEFKGLVITVVHPRDFKLLRILMVLVMRVKSCEKLFLDTCNSIFVRLKMTTVGGKEN